MNLQSKPLKIKLGKRNFFPLQIILLSCVVGWLSNRSYELVPALISTIVGGLIVWFFLASPLTYKLYRHRIPLVRYISLIIGIFALVELLHEFIPWLMRAASANA